MLFETGPGNGWIVKPWARSAPHPRGASFALEIYRRLPNDTDFSILKRHDVPGLNFAAIGDSYAYHTARDTADRLPDESLRTTGENVVQTAIALDALDLVARSSAEPDLLRHRRDRRGVVGTGDGVVPRGAGARVRAARVVQGARRERPPRRTRPLDPRRRLGARRRRRRRRRR